MSIGALTSSSVLRQLADMRKQLDILHEQLGTGKRGNTYAQLGSQRSISLNAHARVQSIVSFQQNISTADLRFNMIQKTLERFDAISAEQRSDNLASRYAAADGPQTQDQRAAYQRLDEIIGLLNQNANGRHFFSGRATDTKASLTANEIINGAPPQAGLYDVIEERRRADLGSDNRGRMAISSPAAGQVRLAETTSGVFGFKISAVSSNLSNASAVQNAGPPPRIDFTFTGLPQNGQSTQVVLDLPDGKNTTLQLYATTSTPPASNEFVIGADANATAVNFQAALDAKLQELAKSDLRAASAFKSADDFFNVDATHVPQRVNIVTTPEAATSLRNGDTFGAISLSTTTQAETLGNSGNGAAIVAVPATLYSFTVDLGSGPVTVDYTSGGADTATDIANALIADFNANVPGAGVTIEAVLNDTGDGVRVRALNADIDFTIGAGAGNSGLTPAAYASTSLLDNIGGAGTLSVAVNGGSAQTITFGTGGGQISTLAELNTALGALSGVTASLTGNTLSFNVASSSTQNTLVVTGSSAGVNTALGTTSVSGVTQQGASSTVNWYLGDDAVDDARFTSTVRVDTALTLGYGMRATETPFRQIISSLAVFATVEFNPSDAASEKAYASISSKARDRLVDPTVKNIDAVQAEFASTQATMLAAKERHTSVNALFQNTIFEVEGITEEEVASLILDLQTRLQASYQVTANLSKLSLVNFL